MELSGAAGAITCTVGEKKLLCRGTHRVVFCVIEMISACARSESNMVLFRLNQRSRTIVAFETPACRLRARRRHPPFQVGNLG